MATTSVKVVGGGYSKCGLQTCRISTYGELVINTNPRDPRPPDSKSESLRVCSRNVCSKFSGYSLACYSLRSTVLGL